MCDSACVHVVHSNIYLLLPNFKNLNFSQAIKKLMLALKLIIWIKYEKWNNSNRRLVISSSSVHSALLPFLCHPGQVFGLHGRIRARFHLQFLQRWVGERNNGKLIFQRYLFFYFFFYFNGRCFLRGAGRPNGPHSPGHGSCVNGRSITLTAVIYISSKDLFRSIIRRRKFEGL